MDVGVLPIWWRDTVFGLLEKADESQGKQKSRAGWLSWNQRVTVNLLLWLLGRF